MGQTEKSLTQIDIETTKELFARFQIIYGHKWASNFSDNDIYNLAAHEWAYAIKGIDRDVIKKTIDRCKENLEWPPSIAEFRRMCKSISGIPNFEEAYKQIVFAKLYPHYTKEELPRLLKDVRNKITSWEWGHLNESQLKQKIREAYENVCNENDISKLKQLSELKNDDSFKHITTQQAIELS